MKQLLQNINDGEAIVAEVPIPATSPDKILVRVARSLVSAGTERMVVDFAEKNLIQKARSRPDLVKQTLEKAQREGVLTTYEAVQNRLALPMALGYSCAGVVLEVGQAVTGIRPGDRVACAGGGYAVHAEVVAVPQNLVVRLPETVDFEAAAFTTLGAIALQGIRLADVKLGEVVAVIGLGLLGQLTVQMLKAAGCVVIGMDIQPERAALALQSGADAATASEEEFVALASQHSQGHGVDAALITADTKSNGPVALAGEIARKKGVVVAVGAVGMEIPRKVYYEKELAFHISSSYGPGRYDPDYEEKGRDYPYAYVRWTENRNMQAFVQMLGAGQVDVRPLISHRFSIEKATQAYDLITGKLDEPFLGVLLTYPQQPDMARTIVLRRDRRPATGAGQVVEQLPEVRLGVLGAGNFANATLLPAIQKLDSVQLVAVVSGGGVSARSTADRFGFAYCTTDSDQILSDNTINTVAILTRHHLHARQVIAALQAGKHVFVEKPLCLTEAELADITATYEATRTNGDGPALMVGFNRRFAPFVVELKQHLASISEPIMLHYRVNAGYIPPDHWTQDPVQGGGRLLGEGVHFVDLLLHLAASPLQRVTTTALPDAGRYSQDNFVVTLEFANGSIGTVSYLANGNRAFGKELLEVFGGGLAARLDDYRSLLIEHGSSSVKRKARLRQDKGHRAEWEALAAHLTARAPAPMSLSEIVASTRATLAARQSLRTLAPVIVE